MSKNAKPVTPSLGGWRSDFKNGSSRITELSNPQEFKDWLLSSKRIKQAYNILQSN
jgi:hypothetical protein